MRDKQVKVSSQQSSANEDDWSLSPAQMLFLLQRRNAIEEADERDDDKFFETLENSSEFKALFDGMGFDEAYDRFETSLEAGRGG